MMKNTINPRRVFIHRCVRVTGMLATGVLAWAGCGKKQEKADAPPGDALDVSACDDLSGLSGEELAVRTKLGYVEETPLPDNHCGNCNLYLPPKEGRKCGGCMLFKGPVFSDAYCTYWAPKV